MAPFLNLGLNVTTDNFFTGKVLGDYLMANKTTLLGTCRSNKLFIPPYCKEKMDLHASRVVYEQNASLTAYQSKKDVRVFLYSTMHKNVQISNENKKLPETIEEYNHTKCGVDLVDNHLKKYSLKVPCKRWTMAVFYNLLNYVISNAHVIYKEVNGVKLTRFAFMRKLVDELLEVSEEENVVDVPNSGLKFEKRVRCKIKVDCKGNKTTDVCSSCKKPCCGQCAEKICLKCKSS